MAGEDDVVTVIHVLVDEAAATHRESDSLKSVLNLEAERSKVCFVHVEAVSRRFGTLASLSRVSQRSSTWRMTLSHADKRTTNGGATGEAGVLHRA